MSAELHPSAGHDVPAFITAPGEGDTLMTVMAVVLVLAVLAVGILFLRLHTLPERMAHKAHKLQFEIVAVLGLLALFTHIHAFWVAGLLLALIDLPDFGTPLRRISRSLEKIAGIPPSEDPADAPDRPGAHAPDAHASSAHAPSGGASLETGGSSTTAATSAEHAVEKRRARSGTHQDLIDA
jgi:hypothetical protein